MAEKKVKSDSSGNGFIIFLIVGIIFTIYASYVTVSRQYKDGKYQSEMQEGVDEIFADNNIHCGEDDASALKKLGKDNYIVSCFYFRRDPKRECYTATYVGENTPDKLTKRKFKLERTHC